MWHETAQQPLLKLLRIATAAARLLPLTAAATVQCSAVPHTATQQNSKTAKQQNSKTAKQQNSKQRALSTEIKEQHTHRHPITQRRSYTHRYTVHSTCSPPRK
jgi:hypothetical protein